ncbi:MAG: YlxR family protein [Clostridia bacterium]|nr:YlxR family protein [Clostridia bacterium]
MVEKKIPMRKCLGCMQSFPKQELIRIVRTPENEVLIDLKGKKSGRGAYLCKDKACLKKAIKAKRIQNNLEVQLSEELIETLTKELDGIEQ